MVKKEKDPGLAAVFSFLFNGLGQIYNGEIAKGLAIISITSLCIIVIIVGGILSIYAVYCKLLTSKMFIWGVLLFVSGIALAIALGIYSIYDAYNSSD